MKTQKEDDDFILKQLITCKWCWRKLTGWNTSKKLKDGTVKYHSYYGCQLEWCPERVNARKQELEQKIIDMIQNIQFSPKMMAMFDESLLGVWWGKEADWNKEVKAKENRAKAIKIEKEQIEQFLMSWKGNVNLQVKMDENWAELDVEEKLIVEQLSDEDMMRKDKNNTLKKIRELIKSPLIFREQWDRSLRKQLTEVRFGDSLTYSKSQQLQTSDTPVLYNVLYDLKHKYTRIYPEGDLNPHVLTDTRFWV